MAKVREKQLLKRKEETLDIAIQLLMERGYANLSMDELAEEVGISKPTLYQYFNSKEELVAQAFVRMFEKMEERFAESTEKPPLEQLEQFLRVMLSSRLQGKNMMGQMDIDIMRSIARQYPYIKEHMAGTRNRISQIVTKGQELGEIDPTIPSWVVVSLMFSLQGILNHPFWKSEGQRSDEELADVIESIVRIFKRAVQVQLPIEQPR